MPRLPIDYSKAFIYKICCKDKNIEECYIGSSTNFVKRKNSHKTICNNINSKEYNQKKYIFIYTPPKVGSTTLVSTLRLALNNKYSVIQKLVNID